MMNKLFVGGGTFLWLSCGLGWTQEAGQVDELQRQLREANEAFQKAVEQHQQVIQSLQQQLEHLQEDGAPAGKGRAPEASPVSNQEPVSPPPDQAESTDPSAAATKPTWRPSDPISLWSKGNNYLNLAFNGLFAVGGSTADDIEGGLELGAHDPNQRGFTVQNLELTLDGMVDPYFRGQGSIIYQIDREGESGLEVEEVYMESLSLPWNLQVRGGQYFSEFGRLNPTHPHAWDFVDQPLVNGRFLGGDGLRNPGARLAWLAPTPFYSEFFISVQNSQGETAASFRNDHEDEIYVGRLHEVEDVSSVGDMLFVPRYAGSTELTDQQTLLWGASAAFGPNASGKGADTQIYGVDLTWKWRPVRHHGGFPFVLWQTEGMWRRFDAARFDWDLNGDGVLDPGEVGDPATGLPAVVSGEGLDDYGFYTQLVYGFRKGWLAGLRFDYVSSDRADYESRGLILDGETLGRDPDRASRWRLSPNLTWYPSEYSKFRLQYNYDDRQGIGEDHSVWFQFEFVLGAHAAHKF